MRGVYSVQAMPSMVAGGGGCWQVAVLDVWPLREWGGAQALWASTSTTASAASRTSWGPSVALHRHCSLSGLGNQPGAVWVFSM